MYNTPTDKIISIAHAQKEFFRSGATLDIAFRKEMLKKLLGAMEKWESKLSEALWTDLGSIDDKTAFIGEADLNRGERRVPV